MVQKLLLTDFAASVRGTAGGQHRRAYTPFGALHRGAHAYTGVAFNGEWLAGSVGVYGLGNGRRFYSPSLRRFLQPDAQSPFGRGGENATAYCSADPVNRYDPTGNFAEAILPVALNAATIVFHLAGIAGRSVKSSPKLSRYGLALGVLGSVTGVAALMGGRQHPQPAWVPYAPWVSLGLGGLSIGLRMPEQLTKLKGVGPRRAVGRVAHAFGLNLRPLGHAVPVAWWGRTGPPHLAAALNQSPVIRSPTHP